MTTLQLRALGGEKVEATVGIGLFTTGASTSKNTLFEVMPPGFVTLTLNTPAELSVTGADKVVELMNEVGRPDPPKLIVAPLMKFDPETAIVTWVPCSPDVGEISPITGTGFEICMVNAAEVKTVATVVAGFCTAMAAEPVAALAGIVAVNCVVEENEVAMGVLPSKTVEPETKLAPVIVIVWPGTMVAGVTPVIVGGGTGTTEKLPAIADPPPGAGFVTPIGVLPVRCRKLAGSVPLSDVAEPNVVATGVPPKVITDDATKLDPVI